MWNLSKFNNRDARVKFFQLFWCCCCCCCYDLTFLMFLLTLNILYLLRMSLMLPSGIFLWTTNQCFIYLSSGKTLVGNCANDWPYGVFFRDTCLKIVMKMSFLLFFIVLQFPLRKLKIISFHLFFTSCFNSLLTWSKFFIMF